MRSRKLLNTVLISLLFSLIGYANDNVTTIPMKDEGTSKIVLGAYLEETPSSDVYDDWNNFSAHAYVLNVPDQFEIDLTDFSVPIKSNQVNSRFGKRMLGNHKGVDLKAKMNDTIYAAFDGKVRVVRYDPGGYGNFVVVRHHNGLETVYGHMTMAIVRPNQYVLSGQPIGFAGSTGRSTGVHLHFETRFCGIPINPERMISFELGEPIVQKFVFEHK